ncbi:uncharacterized protein LOC122057805 isoform X2 [Macadamia integrifolia]|uniref:uncharacterized protein LOC122057805 isoform X2 n=1 Tax=Macadamia integrifolia TaxID=60698 RepID=UPI001C52797B|nr:uncharacterized protein LOC122057805 isoform X2 [Macadamia integrifolia]
MDNRDSGSDQSISDYDEDFDRGSLCEPRRKQENTMGSKVPIISGGVKFKNDHLHGLEIENQDETCSWSSVLKETEKLVFSHENTGSSSSYMAHSDVRKISKAVSRSRGKTKPKFSFRYHSHMEETYLPCIVKDECDKSSMVSQLPVGLVTLEHKAIDHSMTELLENLREKNKKQSDVHKPAKSLDVGNRHLKHSMAELLEGLQDKNGHATGTSKNSKTKGRRLELSTRRNISTLCNRTLDYEDFPETIGSGTSSEDETNDQNQAKLVTREMRVRTMADQFQEALSSAAANKREILFTTSKEAGTGYHGRLLQVMQTEKERHVEFWKQLQTGAHSPNKERCIDVKILSRCLDAKLTVCHCFLGENTEINKFTENPQKIMEKVRREKTIIFSPTVCGNVELEAGNLIRVHPPWR